MKPTSYLLEQLQVLEQIGELPTTISVVSADSRKMKTGGMFVAIRGFIADGHDFIDQAVESGAEVVVCENLPTVLSPKTAFVRVEDTRLVASQLAQAWQDFPVKKLTMLAVTGTNGKTTVSTLVYQALGLLGYDVALLGTVEKRFGDYNVPSRLTTADPFELAENLKTFVDMGASHVVMEVSSHALDQNRVAGLDFAVAAFTNLSQDHLDYHGTMVNYAKAKKSLFDDLPSSAIAVINADSEWASKMVADTQASVWPFSFSQESGFSIVEESIDGLLLDFDGFWVRSPLCGRFNAYNLAGAYLMCLALGANPRNIALALSQAVGAEGRLERVGGTDELHVFVDYAHTPDALENVLQTLRKAKRKDQALCVVFGCGGDRDRGKRPQMGRVAAQLADKVVLTSDNPRSENPNEIIDEIRGGLLPDAEAVAIVERSVAVSHAIWHAPKDSIVLLAGKGHETYQEIAGQRIDMDDRMLAREALEKRGLQARVEGLV